MNILIIEDDPNKAKQLNEFFSNVSDVKSITTKSSYKTGLKEILKNEYHFLVLDMSMPTFDISTEAGGGKVMHFGGKEILRQLRRKKVNIPTVVVTQFESFGEEKKMTLDKLKDELSQEFSDNYIKTIYYNPAGIEWKHELQDVVDNFEVK
ncbi:MULTISPECIES: response regulator [Bacillus]|uniref:response regulator n=1 Tax=Bacillus TaxID=1386 RepID=UPI0014838646|nr:MULTISPECIES: response regulator [Bacillus cereus group]MCU7393001.1 response regulator [Bacillus sp. ST24]MEB9553201.1 response regulator [Bacillus cereus]MCH5470513.1 response regulator [Bacillus toyonensis]MEB9571454.1 response regulator [Bacillus cereus]UKS63161.1 response regulator [Bacillus toyonensis]